MSQIPSTDFSHTADWVALMIGNSRLHWAIFTGNQLRTTWDSPHLALGSPLPRPVDLDGQELWIASVVPAQRDRWTAYPNARFFSLEQIPLKGMYPTLGIDRALAVWGAIATIGSPVLVIDAGTALTFTGVDANHQLVGGAILPGLRLQLQSLEHGTAALPELRLEKAFEFTRPFPRWALDTEQAIASGVVYTLVAGIRSFIADWQRQFPGSAVVLTGGDSDRLAQYLQQPSSDNVVPISVDSKLVFWGMQAARQP